MNKRQIEVHKKLLNDEEDVLEKLEENYRKALDEIQEKIKILQADELTQSKIYQLEYQRALEKQVTGILEVLKGNNFQTVNEYLKVCYEDSLIGTLYDLHGQGIPLIFPINQEETATMIQKTHNDIKLSKRLYDNVDVLKDEVISEVSRGISNGYSWQQVARNLTAYSGISLHRAKTIAQTEGHRVQQQSQMKTLEKAKDVGADVVKQWDSTLDSRTREDHQKLDGQIRELDEPFEVNGRKAMYPGGFRIASEDINCRCCMLQRAKWAMDEEELEELKKRAEFFGIDKTDDFEEFKTKFFENIVTDADTKAIYDYMGSKSYIINEKLRDGMELSDDDKNFIKELDTALDKMSVYKGNLQRSLYFKTQENVEEFLKSYSPDGIIKYREYLSTTKGESYNPDGQVQIFIQDALNGKDISVLNPKEQEVVYKRDSCFVVLDILNIDDVYYILLGETNE